MCFGSLTHMGNKFCMLGKTAPSLCQKVCWIEKFLCNTSTVACTSTEMCTKAEYQIYRYSDYSAVKCYSHIELSVISRFTCGCDGLHDTGCLGKGTEHCSRADRVCLAQLRMSTIFCLSIPYPITYMCTTTTFPSRLQLSNLLQLVNLTCNLLCRNSYLWQRARFTGVTFRCS